jgi:hypothetical protein
MERTALIFKDQVGQYMAQFLVKPIQKIITTHVKDNHLAVNWKLLNLLTNDEIFMFFLHIIQWPTWYNGSNCHPLLQQPWQAVSRKSYS